MKIDRIDHIVLTVKNIEQTIQFYTDVLGMETISFGAGRKALIFGNQKINLYEQGKELEQKENFPTCGSRDLCFITSTKVEEVKMELKNKKIEIFEGIVERTGQLERYGLEIRMVI